jgi:hypothetical protein
MRFQTQTVSRPASAVPAPDPAVVYDEAARILRMTCKDFLWEYDLMKEIAGGRLINHEQLLMTSLAMYGSKHDLPGESWPKLSQLGASAIRTSVKKCRTKPTEMFWSGVFEAALASRFGE